MFHRNRCAQIRRGTDLDKLYHVKTEFNPADVPTRPNLVKEDDVGPNSVWEKGLPWMNNEVQDAINEGILTPAKKLKPSEFDETEYKEGFVFDRTPDVLTRGHFAMVTTARMDKVKERGWFSDYLFFPTKFTWEKGVRILCLIRKFARSFKCIKRKLFDSSDNMKFYMFQLSEFKMAERNVTSFCLVVQQLKTDVIDDYKAWEKQNNQAIVANAANKRPETIFKGKHFVEVTEDDLSWSLHYLFSKASLEVKKFYSSDFIKKIAVERNGLLVSRKRILDCQRFQSAGGFEDKNLIGELGLKAITPVIDRYSPVAYSLGDYIHRKVANHAGYENCYRESLNHVFIIQGLGLFREIGEDCIKGELQCKTTLCGVKEGQKLGLSPVLVFSMGPPFKRKETKK